MADGRKNNGGARIGAGRHVASATLAAQEFRKALAEQIKAEAGLWIAAIKDAALGHKMVGKDGEIYDKAPDPNAWQKATERAFGKAPLMTEDDEGNLKGLNIHVQFLAASDDLPPGEDEEAF